MSVRKSMQIHDLLDCLVTRHGGLGVQNVIAFPWRLGVALYGRDYQDVRHSADDRASRVDCARGLEADKVRRLHVTDAIRTDACEAFYPYGAG